MSDERELIIYWLRILYSSNNHIERMEEQEENINEIKRAIELNPVLSSDERNLLAFAYKNPVTTRRNAIRQLQDHVCEGESPIPPSRISKIREFLCTLQNELKTISLDLIDLIDNSLLPASPAPEQRVFYEKMKGDYYRYICENKDEPEFAMFCQKGRVSYDNALAISREELPPTSPLFLGLVLNFSVFLYETMQLHSEAIELSQRTFSETVDMVDSMEDSMYSETTMILRMLKDNHNRWVQLRDHTQL